MGFIEFLFSISRGPGNVPITIFKLNAHQNTDTFPNLFTTLTGF